MEKRTNSKNMYLGKIPKKIMEVKIKKKCFKRNITLGKNYAYFSNQKRVSKNNITHISKTKSLFVRLRI